MQDSVEAPPFDRTTQSTLFSGKRKSSLLLRWQMPSLTRNFAEFLIAQADPRFLRARRDDVSDKS